MKKRTNKHRRLVTKIHRTMDKKQVSGSCNITDESLSTNILNEQDDDISDEIHELFVRLGIE